MTRAQWTEWREAVAWAANEWAPCEIKHGRVWWHLFYDFKTFVLSTYMVRDDVYLDAWLLHFCSTNMLRVQEWVLEWMIDHGYGQKGMNDV